MLTAAVRSARISRHSERTKCSRMRIAFLTEEERVDADGRRAPTDRFASVSEELVSLGHETSVFRVSAASGVGRWSRFAGLTRVFLSVLFGRYDALHVRSAFFLPFAFFARAFRHGIGIVVSVDGTFSPHLVGRLADRITVSGASDAPSLRDRHGGKCVVVPEPLDTERTGSTEFLRGFGLKPGRFILFSPRSADGGQAHYVIKAFRDLEETGKLPNNFKLAVVGGGIDVPEYERTASIAGDRENVLFLGEQEGDARRELFSHATLFVHPVSRPDDMALAEAMGFGLPVVAADSAGNREMLGDAGAAYWHDTGSLALAVARLLIRPDDRESYGSLSERRFRSRYSPESAAGRLSEIYAEAVERRLGDAYGLQRKNHHV